MITHLPEIDFHKYTDEKLYEVGFKITALNEEIMKSRLDDFMDFVNNIRSEHTGIYNWHNENKDYFLNGLVDKWKFSYAITDLNDNICLVNFSSVYNDAVHMHFTYTGKKYRNLGLAKLHMIKLCQAGLDSGFTKQEGYWPIRNNGSMILYLKMGWYIDQVNEEKHCVKLIAGIEEVRNKTFNLLNQSE